ncbi:MULTISPECIES: SprT-like domain-containing protein [Caballeronia]|uniref:SprT-like domain-containing protein n=1 Tax=Caballeronia TaxID=1827195 RepID=UPI001FD465CF|nr:MULTISPECIES: SprT-like domain-containing protein [Caballeronia]MDR5799303.1 SprT-like domain-containing protein [Caballeronia sp. LZ001]
MRELKPTKEAYEALQFAYDFFNERLFNGELRGCLITLNRTGRSFGHFSPQRFVNRTSDITDEINLNPALFSSRPVEDVLSTLAHEQCHQWREYAGTPPRRCYHDKQWSSKMQSIGLQPSSTGSPGGKAVGEKMSHYVVPDGPFIKVCKELLTHSFGIIWFDRYPQLSGKDYAYAGTVAVPAKLAVATGSRGIEVSSNIDEGEPESEEEGSKLDGASVELPVFSPIPMENGLEIAGVVGTGSSSGGRSNSSNRVKYSCAGCGRNIWSSTGLNANCNDCNKPFEQRG